MSITLTVEQNIYVNTSGKVILNACPGSGKTTTIAHKLHNLIQGWESQFSKNGGTACLSFTNVAKNEIAEKYKEISGFSLPYPHIISTIDSFVNCYITLPFAHKVKDFGKRYRIIDDMSYLEGVFLNNWQLKNTYGRIMHTFSPSKIDYTVDNGIAWDGHDKSSDAEFVKYGKAIKSYQFQLGLLKTSDSAFFTFHVLKKYPRLAKYIASKFPYLIIDEAQDTSEIQHSILEMLYNGGLKNIDLVGDPYQCLYQWRNASPELFLKKFDDNENWKGIYLTENRRSTKKIIDVFSLLRRESEQPIVAIQNSNDDLPLHIIKYDSANYAAAISKYENLCAEKTLKSNTVLVRGTALKNSLLGKDDNYSPWHEALPKNIIASKIHLQSNEIKEAVKKVRRIVIRLRQPNITYAELREQEEFLRNDKNMNALIFNLIREIPSFDLAIKDWTIQTQQYLKDVLELDNAPDFNIKKNNSKSFHKATLNNPVNQYFKKSITDNNLPVTTIHQVKGMTFDSVFLLLSSNSKGQSISLKDIVPKDEMPSEKKRLIYVAISRPRALLCIGVPEATTNEELMEKFNNEIVIL